MNKWFELNYTIDVIALITGGVVIAGMMIIYAASTIKDKIAKRRAKRKQRKGNENGRDA